MLAPPGEYNWSIRVGAVATITVVHREMNGRCRNVYAVATWASTAASYEYWLTAVVVGFHCDIISCELAWWGMQHGAASGRGEFQPMHEHGNVVGLT